ncbi:endonuclease [Flavobacteriaceae bacterium Ap0902]|nr:endonuclease [Flavobacteriaceae bacterium Ap0902]
MQRFQTIAFYNCENLFDPFNDPAKLDREFTPSGYRKWTLERYENKINKLAMTISKIGEEETNHLPALIGLSEVENGSVLKDLINTPYLKEVNYDFVHYDSYDERGIDVALLYNQDLFHVIHSEPIHPPMLDHGSGRDLTRDVLYVKGELLNKEIHLFVLHLPSQRDEKFNDLKRDAITTKLREKINHIFQDETEPAIMVMGDFNASPDSKSLKRNLLTQKNRWFDSKTNLYNPMELFGMQNKFTNMHGKHKLLFDQMLFSYKFLKVENKPSLYKAEVFNPHFLQEWSRKRKGQPFRTYAGRKYLGGYSDHFPIYSILKL